MKKRLLMTTLAALAIAPLSVPLAQINSTLSVQAQVQQGEQRVALGGSLSAQEAQQTLQLLGAGEVAQGNIVYVDGPMINRYLQDGSGPETVVYSSAYIQGMSEGYGVQVQIVTPQNILSVSPTTYQNAAITAGAKNAQIRVATVSPVTGEGALTGVYALLEQQGLTLNPHDVQVAQREITLVNEINENETVTIDDSQINQMIADIKQDIVVEITGDGNTVDNSNNITQIVNNITNNYGITDEELINVLEQFAQDFAQTDAAQSEDTIEQIEQSIQGDWTSILNGIDGAVAPEEILSAERPDYSDTQVYHPIMQAFANELYRIIEAGEVVDALYSDTFVFEAMTPGISNEDQSAINELRVLMYQYAANIDSEIGAGEVVQPGYGSVKEIWLSKINAFENLKAADPVMGEIISRVAVATGRAPQVYDYIAVSQEDTVITFESVWNSPSGQLSDFVLLTFNTADDSMEQQDYLTGEMTSLASGFDFGARYGVNVENGYISMIEIPADYTIPGYIPSDETEESEVSEEESTPGIEETSDEQETEQPEESVETGEDNLPENPDESEEDNDLPIEDDLTSDEPVSNE